MIRVTETSLQAAGLIRIETDGVRVRPKACAPLISRIARTQSYLSAAVPTPSRNYFAGAMVLTDSIILLP
jgi:hypothetical protein